MASLLTHWVKYPGSIRTLFRTSGISSNSFAKDPTGGSWTRGDASSLPVAILSLVCDNSPIPSQQTWAKKPFKNQMVTPIKKNISNFAPSGHPKNHQQQEGTCPAWVICTNVLRPSEATNWEAVAMLPCHNSVHVISFFYQVVRLWSDMMTSLGTKCETLWQNLKLIQVVLQRIMTLKKIIKIMLLNWRFSQFAAWQQKGWRMSDLNESGINWTKTKKCP